jgi:hypothetical protein
MSWPFATDETAVTRETNSTWWKVKTYYKKSCDQIEYLVHSDHNDPIKVHDGFRFAEFDVETNDGNPPEFNWTTVPGGNGAVDSINLYDCFGNNVENTELVEMFDGGCWGDIEWPDSIDETEQERLQQVIDEQGTYELEESEGWTLDETECWVWGPIIIEDQDGNQVKIVQADDDGNTIEFVEEE